ncbi:MAG: dihydroorotate dehydrogenase electron transfer subunit [Lachnospiraceae bacterium]|nr:dihydroorotate dehydrogenase electron transfer subunit [Lachnospiraceae bacterium]MDE6184883.1 dihydroorotate dehydrogenase electron transfer subunit [Lachnospiraceae bacterium]
MSGKRKVRARVLHQKMIAPDIYDMWLSTDLAKTAGAGQFIGVYPKDKAHLLPRPISICEVDREKNALRIVYRIAGAGTAEFATWETGQEAELLGVLGNGFPVDQGQKKKVALMGGGIGIPPMLQLAKQLKAADSEVAIVLGYRDGQLFLKEDLEKHGTVYIATEDGSAGIRGNVLNVMNEEQIKADVIMACGPMPMLRAIKSYAEDEQIEAYISLEERMACGVGACLGCVCKTTHKDAHSHVNNARICTDGPVFDVREVEI